MKFLIVHDFDQVFTSNDLKFDLQDDRFYLYTRDDKQIKHVSISQYLSSIFIKTDDVPSIRLHDSIIVYVKLSNNNVLGLLFFVTSYKQDLNRNVLVLYGVIDGYAQFFNTPFNIFRTYADDSIEIYSSESVSEQTSSYSFIYHKKLNWIIFLKDYVLLHKHLNLYFTNFSSVVVVDYNKLVLDGTIFVLNRFNHKNSNLFFFDEYTNKYFGFNSKYYLSDEVNSSGFYYKYKNYVDPNNYIKNENLTTTGQTTIPNYKGITIADDGSVIVTNEADGSFAIEDYDKIKVVGTLIGYPDQQCDYTCTDTTPDPKFNGKMQFFASIYCVSNMPHLDYWDEGSQSWKPYWSVSVDYWANRTFYKYPNNLTLEFKFASNKKFVPVNLGDAILKVGTIMQGYYMNNGLHGKEDFLPKFQLGRYEEEWFFFERYRMRNVFDIIVNYLTGTKALIKYNHNFKLVSKIYNKSATFNMEFQDKERSVFKYPLRLRELIQGIAQWEQYIPMFKSLYGDKTSGQILSPIFGIRSLWGIYQQSDVDYIWKEFSDNYLAKGFCKYSLYDNDKEISAKQFSYSIYTNVVHPYLYPNTMVERIICDISLKDLDLLIIKPLDDKYYIKYKMNNTFYNINIANLEYILKKNKILKGNTNISDIVSVDIFKEKLHFIDKKSIKIFKPMILLN